MAHLMAQIDVVAQRGPRMTQPRHLGPPVYCRAGEAVRAERVAAPWLEAKQRKCLRCQRTFDSPHAGVRMCDPCHKASEGG
jgi:hypothetical protein